MAGRLLLMGLDPGLRRTGWGLIAAEGNRLGHLGHGLVTSDADAPLAERLRQIYDGLSAVLAARRPDAVAVEESFVNKNPASTLKLGQVRGVVLLAPAVLGIPVWEYAPNQVKKAVIGAGHADKTRIQAMVARLLPGAAPDSADAADALAVAICHAHYGRGPLGLARLAERAA